MTQPPPLDYGRQIRSPWKKAGSIFGWSLFILLALVFFVMSQGKNGPLHHRITVGDFERMLTDGAVGSITIEGDDLYGDLLVPTAASDGTMVSSYRTTFPRDMTQSWPFIEHLLANRGKATVSVDSNRTALVEILVPLIPWLLIFGFVWFFLLRPLRARAGQPQQPMPVIVVNQPPPKG